MKIENWMNNAIRLIVKNMFYFMNVMDAILVQIAISRMNIVKCNLPVADPEGKPGPGFEPPFLETINAFEWGILVGTTTFPF